MGTSPFFSILIPTKNRSHLIGYAISSVLQQTFQDFEILIGDSDDDPQATLNVVSAFKDERISYFRTGSIPMADNWQYLLERAKGKYITILEDKQTYYPDALQRIHSIATTKMPESICWKVDSLVDDFSGIVLRKYQGSGKLKEYAPEEILDMYINQREGFWDLLPRTINSCFSADFVQRVYRETPLSRFFIPVAPDLCAAFIQLALVNAVVAIDSSLSIFGATSLSNAKKIRMGEKSESTVRRELGMAGTLKYVPIQSLQIIKSLILNDFCNVQQVVGARLTGYRMSNAVYVKMCLHDLYLNRCMGGISKTDLRLLHGEIRNVAGKDWNGRGAFILFFKTWVRNALRRLSYTFPRLRNFFLCDIVVSTGSPVRLVIGFRNAFEAANGSTKIS